MFPRISQPEACCSHKYHFQYFAHGGKTARSDLLQLSACWRWYCQTLFPAATQSKHPSHTQSAIKVEQVRNADCFLLCGYANANAIRKLFFSGPGSALFALVEERGWSCPHYVISFFSRAFSSTVISPNTGAVPAPASFLDLHGWWILHLCLHCRPLCRL